MADTESQSSGTRTGLPDSVLCKKWGEISGDERLALIRHYVVAVLGFPRNIVDYEWPPWYPTATDELKKFTHPNNVSDYNSCLISGPVGTGKTVILCNMVKDLFTIFADEYPDASTKTILNQFVRPVYFFHYREFTKLIRQSLQEGAEFTIDDVKDDWSTYPLLIIDDLLDGVVKDWDLTCLGEIIDRRYCNGLRTWITTNYPAKAVQVGDPDLESWEGFERSYSRLADQKFCRYYEIIGEDRRRTK